MDVLSYSCSAFNGVRMHAALPSNSLHLARFPSSMHTAIVPAIHIDEKPQTHHSVWPNPNTRSVASGGATPAPPSRHKRVQAPRRNGLSFLVAFCDALDVFINSVVDPPARWPAFDARKILHGNFAPVDELPPTPCHVVRGTIPRCLAGGAYIRNGPNPQHVHRGPYHLFDGDGMLHSLLLPSDPDGRAILCSRYVRTYRHLLERDVGAPVVPSFFAALRGLAGMARAALITARVVSGQLDPREGLGLANTSLTYFGGRLYALGEPDLPYAVSISLEDGDIATLGRCDFEGRLQIAMTAHPKKDPDTGELFAFRYWPMLPYVTYFRFDADGNKVGQDVPIPSVTRPSMIHDFAITEHFAIFPDFQIVITPMKMLVGGGAFVGADPMKVPRLGVLSRYAESAEDMLWVDAPGLNPAHLLNAWEENDEELVVVVANLQQVENLLEDIQKVHACIEMVRIELGGRSGSARVASRTLLSAGNLEFGVMHPGYVGRKHRYAYFGVSNSLPKMDAVVKLDFSLAGKEDCIVARRHYGIGCFGGEPFFIPKREKQVGEEGEEDEGYLVTYVHDEVKGETRFVVMDAQSPDLEIVAEVLLPQRVPYGFHGTFVAQEELRAQRLDVTPQETIS